MTRDEAMDIIRDALTDGHPNPEGFLEYLGSRSDEEVCDIAHNIRTAQSLDAELTGFLQNHPQLQQVITSQEEARKAAKDKLDRQLEGIKWLPEQWIAAREQFLALGQAINLAIHTRALSPALALTVWELGLAALDVVRYPEGHGLRDVIEPLSAQHPKVGPTPPKRLHVSDGIGSSHKGVKIENIEQPPPAWAMRAALRISTMPQQLTKESLMWLLVREQLADMWQPIETAPKDGTFSLFYVPDTSSGRPTFAIMHWVSWAGGCWQTDAGFNSGFEPTRWMPLPNKPST